MPSPEADMLRPARAYIADTPEPDRALLRRYTAGDHAAFAALLDRHGPLVLGACRRVLGARSATADDAFQATFLVLARKAARLRDPDSLPGWLFGVARRVAAASRRRDLRQDRTARAAAKPEAARPAGEWDDLLAVVDEEIAALPDDLRAAVLLCLYHGKSQDEAAGELGWSLSTLRRRLDRGRDLLRSRLTTRGVAPAVALVAGAVAPSAVSAVPAELRAAALDLAAGGTVPAAVTALARVGAPRVTGVGLGWVATGVLTAGVVVGIAWVGPDRPQVGAQAGAPLVPEPPKSEMLPDLPATPLPPRAVARIGTTRFRHGTGGAFGIVEPIGLTRLVFLPDDTLASVGGGRVRFWDTATGAERHADGPGIGAASKWALRALPFDGGRRLLLPDNDPAGNLIPSAQEWNLADRTAGRRIAFTRHADRKGNVIGPTAASADGTRFAQTDGNGDGWVWNADGTPGAKLAGKVREYGPTAFLPGGAELVAAGGDKRFHVWDAATGKELRAFGDSADLMTAAVSADGTRVATVAEDDDVTADPAARTLAVWDAATGAEVRRFPLGGVPGFAATGGALAFTPDGRHVAAVAHVNGRMYDVRWWAIEGTGSGHWGTMSEGCPPHPLAVANDLRVLAVSCGDAGGRSVVRVFEGTAGREKVPAGGIFTPVRAVGFAAEGREVVTVTAHGGALTWDAATGERKGSGMKAPPDPPVTDPGFDVAAAVGVQAAPRIVVKAVVPSPDGKRLAVAAAVMGGPPDGWGRVYVLDAATKTSQWSAPIPDAAATSLAFSADGSRLAVGSTVVRLFATADGAPGLVLDGHRGAVTALAFAPDGKRLVSGGADTTAVVWNVE